MVSSMKETATSCHRVIKIDNLQEDMLMSALNIQIINHSKSTDKVCLMLLLLL